MNIRRGPKKLSIGTALKFKEEQMNWGTPEKKKEAVEESRGGRMLLLE